MINKNYIKPKLSTFLFVTFLSNLIIYLVQFYYFKESAEYFLCTTLINYDTSIFSRQLNLIYPESCDLKVYAEGITNFLCPIAELVKEINVEPLANVAPNTDASALPDIFSKLIVTLFPVPTDVGSGFKYA